MDDITKLRGAARRSATAAREAATAAAAEAIAARGAFLAAGAAFDAAPLGERGAALAALARAATRDMAVKSQSEFPVGHRSPTPNRESFGLLPGLADLVTAARAARTAAIRLHASAARVGVILPPVEKDTDILTWAEDASAQGV